MVLLLSVSKYRYALEHSAACSNYRIFDIGPTLGF
jgi:hypothetical protein